MSKPLADRAELASEYDEQVAVVQWAAAHEHIEPRLALLHAIPLGELRAKRTAGRLKAAGAKSGVPDLCLPVVRYGSGEEHHGLYIEMKRRRAPPSALSASQRWWIDRLSDQGYRVEVCRGADEAISALRFYLGMRQ